MTCGTQILQQLIVSHLASDTAITTALGGPKLYDRPPDRATFPYVTLGQTAVFDQSTASETAHEHLVTLHIWSRKGGRLDALQIQDLLRTRLETLPATSGSLRIVSLRFEYQEVRHDPEVDAYHGTLRYRGFTEGVVL